MRFSSSSNAEFVSTRPLPSSLTEASKVVPVTEVISAAVDLEPEIENKFSSTADLVKLTASEPVSQPVQPPSTQEHARQEMQELEEQVVTCEERWFAPEGASKAEHFYGPSHDQRKPDELELGFQISEPMGTPEDFAREGSTNAKRPPPEVFTAETVVDENFFRQNLPEIPSNSSAGAFRILDGNIDSRVNSPVGSVNGDEDGDEGDEDDVERQPSANGDHNSAPPHTTATEAEPEGESESLVNSSKDDQDEDQKHNSRQDDIEEDQDQPSPTTPAAKNVKVTAATKTDIEERSVSPSERRTSLNIRSLQSPSERPISPKSERYNDKHGLLRRMRNSLRKSSRDERT